MSDVVCLQEVDDRLVERIAEALPDAHFSTAFHPHRQDGVMVLSPHEPTYSAALQAGEMGAAALRVTVGGCSVVAVSAHLEWSADGVLGARQAASLLAAVAGVAGADVCVVGMDANASAGSPVHLVLREGGWRTTGDVTSAYFADRGWVGLDVVAVQGGDVEGVDVWGRGEAVPSLAWPSDHCALVASVSGVSLG